MELKALIIFVLGTDDFDKRNRNGREITPPDNPVTAITSDIYVLANTTTDMGQKIYFTCILFSYNYDSFHVLFCSANISVLK